MNEDYTIPAYYYFVLVWDRTQIRWIPSQQQDGINTT